MDILENMVLETMSRLAQRQDRTSLDDLKAMAAVQSPPMDAVAALRDAPGALPVVAEIRRRSTVTGRLNSVLDAGMLARAYSEAGASMISVFTEETYFGCVDDLETVRATVDIPVLCRGFVITPYQVHEARAYGADAVLLLASVLEQPVLVSLVERVKSLGMSAHVQASSRLEVFRGLDAGADMIGVGAPNPGAPELSVAEAEQCLDAVPLDKLAVAETSLISPRDVRDWAHAGADAVLVGEALATERRPGYLLSRLVSAGAHPSLSLQRSERSTRRRGGSPRGSLPSGQVDI